MLIEALDDRSLAALMSKFTTEQQDKIINSIGGKVNQEILNKLIELQDKLPEGTGSMEAIQEFIRVEVRSIATPGYNSESNPRIKSVKRTEQKETPDSIDKQEAIQKVLLEHFKIDQEAIIVLTEAETQRDLSHKYTAYYAQIQGTGILIVLNNEYGQAARIKKVENQEDAQTQLHELKEILEGVDKRTMDEDYGFHAFDNIYSSQEDLESLYINKITDYLESFEEINLDGSAAEIWLRIKSKTLITGGKLPDKQLETIQDFLGLSISAINRGKIGNTTIRDIINTMLGLEEDDKITSHTGGKEGEANKKRVENAKGLLKQLVLSGELGDQAQEEYEASLKIENAESIWKSIKLQTVKAGGKHPDKQLETIQDFLGLSFSVIRRGTIGNTPIKDIINKMLDLREDQKITSHSSGPKGEANKKRVEYAKVLLKERVLSGELGDAAKEEYEDYQANLYRSPEQIWNQVAGETIKTPGLKDKTLTTMQDFLDLSRTVIITGTIGNTPIRDIINTMLGLEEDDNKITYHMRNHPKGEANKARIQVAKELLKKKALAGELGIQAQAELLRILDAEKIQSQISSEINEI